MERREYERLAAVEDRMWWFAGLHRNLITTWRAAALARAGNRAPAPRLLDAGCGTGGLLRQLTETAPGALLCGIDLDERACGSAQRKSCALVSSSRVERLPFAAASFDAIFSADVLCQRGVDARAALEEFRRCLRSGGILVVNLPAYRWLYSAHDAAVENARRYRLSEVRTMLAAAGFRGIRPYYWNGLLFPLLVLRRKFVPRRKIVSDVALLPRPVERMFAAALALERGLARLGLRLPFGGSILAEAIKP